jgi:hypothetical protein
MMRPTFRTQAFAILLSASVAVPLVTFADTTSATSMATSTLQGMTGILGDMNGMFSSFGQSSAQLQAMAAQLAQTQQMAQGGVQAQSAFDQIQKSLSLAMAQANACVMQATQANYDKYLAKRDAQQKSIAKGLAPDALTSVEPTCATYGVIMDAIEMNKAKMVDANKKMTCLTNFQAKIGQIAEAAKAPFQQLTEAAGSVYTTYQQIIDAHNQIANKIATDLDGPVDKDGNPVKGADGNPVGGYRQELGKLKAMNMELNNVLNGAPGQNKDGNLKYGLVKQVENLKQQRVSAANKWYFTLMQDVESCYHSEPAPCMDNDVQLPPDQCISAYVANTAVGSTGKGEGVLANEDAGGLQLIALKNYINASKVNMPSNIDIANPDALLAFSQTRFNATLKGVMGAYGSHHFFSGVDKGKIQSYVHDAYQACYDKASARFKSDLASKGGMYYQDIAAMQDVERQTGNDIKNWMDTITGEMTTFRTMFQKTYNSDLEQFKTDCAQSTASAVTGDTDPYRGLDCIRVMKAELDSGIKGTRVTTKLSNGSNFQGSPANTVLPVQTLTLDAQGKATIGSSTVTCKGFDDCINYLDRARDQHHSAAQKNTEDQKKFVDQHNQATKQAFSVVANQFSQMSQLLVAGVTGINQDLAQLGVKASVKTKQVDSEELKPDEKTGLLGMPKSMKAAMAGQNAYTEIDDDSTKTVTDAFNQLLGDLNKKASDAMKVKNKCRVTKSDYEALGKIMPNDCSKASDVCSAMSSNMSRLSQFQDLLNRSKPVPEDTVNSNQISSDYQRCRSQMLSDNNATSPTDDDIKAASQLDPPLSYTNMQDSNYGLARSRAITLNKARAQRDIAQQCGDVAFPPLVAAAGQGRPPLGDQNKGIVSALQDVSSACSKMTPDEKGKMPIDDADVTSTCEAFKANVAKAEPPKGEEDTGAIANRTGTTSTTDTPSPFTAPAK